jgi:hypothetical protein
MRDVIGSMKVRGSIWSLLVGLVAGITGYVWSYYHEDPIYQVYHACQSREWDQRKIYSRPPKPIMKEIDDKCRLELQTHLIPDGKGGWKLKPKDAAN